MIHFVKAASRLGLRNKPLGQTEINFGVELAPSKILTTEFCNQFDGDTIDFTFTKPEDLAQDYYQTIASESQKLASQITSQAKDGSTVIAVGGDHSITFATTLSLMQRFVPAEIGFIHIDSHADLQQSNTSVSGNFHGMYLRALFDKFDKSEIAALVKQQLLPSNLWLVGNFDLEQPELEFINKSKIKLFSKGESLKSIADEAAQLKHIHINLDIDVFDQSIAPATGIPAKDGLLWPQLLPLVNRLSRQPSWSLDLVEVNPLKPGADQTILLAQNIIKTLIDGSKILKTR